MNWINACRLAAVAAVVIALSGCGGGGSASPTPPSISAQPQAVTVSDGAAASFSVSAGGSQPLSYQWKKNGADIAGAVGAGYTLAAALADNGAQITVLVSNTAGTASSQAAMLTVLAVPAKIDAQPQNASADDGATASFTVQASGSKPLGYQWFRNGNAIQGATAASYTTLDLSMTDDQSRYSVAVSNLAASVTSSEAVLSVRPQLPSFVSPLQSLTVKDGTTVTLNSAAKGTAPLSYQWTRNGVPISGATSSSYMFNAQLTDNGARYAVVVGNAYGSATSATATVTVDANAPAFSTAPVSLSAATGATATFTALATGSAPLAYQWQRSDDGGYEWADIPGARSSTFSVPRLTLAWANAGLRVVASNIAASVPSPAVTLTVVPQVRLMAGKAGGGGYADGQGTSARFHYPVSVASDASGNVYVADSVNGAVRKVSAAGYVSTLADAQANLLPSKLATDSNGNLYVASSSRIVKIDASGAITSLAGSATSVGTVDGAGGAARFVGINGIASDASGNLLVADSSGRTIRKVTSAGIVTTLAGMAGEQGHVEGKASVARFGDLGGIALDADGNAFVVDGQAIRKITPDGTVSRFAGDYTASGMQDGDRLTATRFNDPRGLAFDRAGNLYVAEAYSVRRIDASGQSTTIAGIGSQGVGLMLTDGLGSNAILKWVTAIAPLPSANAMVIADEHTVRVVAANGRVTTLAGSAIQSGSVDGRGSDARFSSPSSLQSAADGSLFLYDYGNGVVRKLNTNGFTETLSSSRFNGGCAMAIDAVGNAYVTYNYAVYKVAGSGGTVSVVAGIPGVSGSVDGPAQSATFNQPCGIAVDARGDIWVAELLDHTIRKISNGVVSTAVGARASCGIAGGAASVARLCNPRALAFDASGALIVVESIGDIRRVATNGTVSTVAGVPFSSGDSDGPVARFSAPTAVAVDASGNVFVADTGNGLIRKIAPNGVTSTVIGVRGKKALVPGPGGSINAPIGVAVAVDGRLFFLSENAVVGD